MSYSYDKAHKLSTPPSVRPGRRERTNAALSAQSIQNATELNRRARVQNAQRVERLLDALVEVHHLGTEVAAQPWSLQATDAVLPGDRSAQADGEVHDLAEREMGPLGHGRVGGVEHDERMRVAVAGMRDHRDHQVALGGDPRDSDDQVAQ